jgi:hypothetical protein
MSDLTRYLEGNAELLMLVSASSAVMMVGSMLLVPWLVVRAPRDLFVREPRARRGVLALLVRVLRNAVAAGLFVAGLLMLVLPGQGLLTMLAAVCLADLPRKRELMRRIAARPAVWRTLAWIRARAGVPPFEPP